MKQQILVNFTNCKPRDYDIFEGIVSSIMSRGIDIPVACNGFIEMLLMETEGTSAFSVAVYRIEKESVVVEVTLERQDDVANTIIERRGLPEYNQAVIKI